MNPSTQPEHGMLGVFVSFLGKPIFVVHPRERHLTARDEHYRLISILTNFQPLSDLLN